MLEVQTIAFLSHPYKDTKSCFINELPTLEVQTAVF